MGSIAICFHALHTFSGKPGGKFPGSFVHANIDNFGGIGRDARTKITKQCVKALPLPPIWIIMKYVRIEPIAHVNVAFSATKFNISY